MTDRQLEDRHHHGVLVMFHSIGQGILAHTETDRPQNPGRAGKKQRRRVAMCQNQKCMQEICEDDVEKSLVRRWTKHDAWNPYTMKELFVTTQSDSIQLDPDCVSFFNRFLKCFSEFTQQLLCLMNLPSRRFPIRLSRKIQPQK